jgi:hypothetical protein
MNYEYNRKHGFIHPAYGHTGSGVGLPVPGELLGRDAAPGRIPAGHIVAFVDEEVYYYDPHGLITGARVRHFIKTAGTTTRTWAEVTR